MPVDVFDVAHIEKDSKSTMKSVLPGCQSISNSPQDARILGLVPDYKINLIAPASINDDDFEKFQTSLKEVLSFIKYSQDADRLGEVLEADEGFRHLGRTAVDVLNACVGARLEMEESEETIEVCLAIEEMKQNAAKIAAEKAAKTAAEC